MESSTLTAPSQPSVAMFYPESTDWFDLNLCQFACQFQVAHYCDDFFARYGIDCPTTVMRAVTKRKAEFLAGRLCAQYALSSVGYTDTTVAIGEHRNPIWPTGLVGAISHSQNRAAVLLANSDEYIGVGLDIEDIVSTQQAEELRRQIVNEHEFALLLRSGLSEAVAFTLAFSLKESFFKAAYADVGQYFGFDALRICAIDVANKTLEVEVAKPLSAFFFMDKRLTAKFCQLDSSTIATAVVVKA